MYADMFATPPYYKSHLKQSELTFCFSTVAPSQHNQAALLAILSSRHTGSCHSSVKRAAQLWAQTGTAAPRSAHTCWARIARLHASLLPVQSLLILPWLPCFASTLCTPAHKTAQSFMSNITAGKPPQTKSPSEPWCCDKVHKDLLCKWH